MAKARPVGVRIAQFDFNLEYRAGIFNPADKLLYYSDYIEGEITHNNILPILTQKLRLLNTLNKTVRRIIIKLLVSNRF